MENIQETIDRLESKGLFDDSVKNKKNFAVAFSVIHDLCNKENKDLSFLYTIFVRLYNTEDDIEPEKIKKKINFINNDFKTFIKIDEIKSLIYHLDIYNADTESEIIWLYCNNFNNKTNEIKFD